MGLDKLIKREIGITIATVLLVTTVFIMFSYAIFKVEVSGGTNAITFGDLSLSFCADSTCNNTLENIGNIIGTKTENGTTRYVPIYPQKDPSTEAEWNELNPYIFTLTNNGDLDLYITLLLEKESDYTLKYSIDHTHPAGSSNDPVMDPSTFTAVDDDQIKIAIGEVGGTPSIKLFSETPLTDNPIITETGEINEQHDQHIIASSLLIKAGETKTYNLYAWLRADAENASQGKYFVTKIYAKGEFLPDTDETNTPETPDNEVTE